MYVQFLSHDDIDLCHNEYDYSIALLLYPDLGLGPQDYGSGKVLIMEVDFALR